jgi:hypothetical protein
MRHGHEELDRALGSLDANECREGLYLLLRANAEFAKADAHADAGRIQGREHEVVGALNRVNRAFELASQHCIAPPVEVGKGKRKKFSELLKIDGAKRRR